MRSERFLRACRRQPVDGAPVWLMRQAGRYLPEYRTIRSKHDFLTMARTPELAAQVTLLPVERVHVDAAILFADILLPLDALGLGVAFTKEDGPAVAHPIRSDRDVAALPPFDPHEQMGYVLETIRVVRRELEGKVPLIGFAGAPFTLASYAVEGGASRDYRRCKEMMWKAPQVWQALMERLADVTLAYLRAQVEAGAQAVQIFDSWVGALSPDDYREHVLPHSRRVLDGLRATGVPVIHFAVQASGYLELIKEAGGDVIGLDWRVDIGEARRRLGPDVAVQGNLDPMALLAPPPVIEAKVARLLERGGSLSGLPGHVVNLGHGVLPDTPVEHVITMVEAVHRLSRNPAATAQVKGEGRPAEREDRTVQEEGRSGEGRGGWTRSS
ncbi:uroporphyrinogen decarboxylase [Limnochorda pilosa]|uniref:Uroporphyrinogen decarboxylase n=1 Tax=Limnochorda pilosa TaxID=1555112 RepID=A0A0K2SI93_LIMPI|nr:uroporphyrinogen decarboxylase [Limnochorda pilosa]BAS26564.1 uroporphyrinogen decarboxylase [Limnochorda pilosa]